MKKALRALLACLLISPLASGQSQSPLPAFPGGEGGGASSVGGSGRNGTGTPQVIYITTTADGTQQGTLRFCVEAAGPRTCIFRVAGLFPVTAGDLRTFNPYLTLACQTAPGQVIIGGPNTGGALMGISSHDFIIRYCTFSPDNPNTISGPSGGTTSIWIVNCSAITQNI